MRYSQGIQFIFAICLFTIVSCQKEAPILIEDPTEIATGEVAKLEIEEFLEAADDQLVDTGETICHHKYEEAYAGAMAEANRTCKSVTVYLDCIINGNMVSTFLKVFPTNDCMTPQQGDPKK